MGMRMRVGMRVSEPAVDVPMAVSVHQIGAFQKGLIAE